jgi:hypothetical protein
MALLRFFSGRIHLILAAVLSAVLFFWLGIAVYAGDKPPEVQGPVLQVEPKKPADSDKTDKTPSPTKPDDSKQNSQSAPKENSPAEKRDMDNTAQKPAEDIEQKSADKPTESKPAETKSADAEKEKLPDSVGEPLAGGMIKLLQEEILAGLKRRGTTDRFARFQRYAIGKVNASAGKYTGSELAGNCRLSWYDHLMRNMLAAPAEAEQFTRQLHLDALDANDGLQKLLGTAAVKLDFAPRQPRSVEPPKTPELALDAVRQALINAQTSYCAALAPLSKSEIRELRENAVRVLCTQNQVGHTLSDRGTGRRLCDLMEKLDRSAMLSAAESLAPLADVRLLEQLKALKSNGDVKTSGVTGTVVERINTPAGAIIVGGRGPNVYHLDQMTDVAAVIDGRRRSIHRRHGRAGTPSAAFNRPRRQRRLSRQAAGHPGRRGVGHFDAPGPRRRRLLSSPGRGARLGHGGHWHPDRLRRQRPLCRRPPRARPGTRRRGYPARPRRRR